MLSSDWSSVVCSSDLIDPPPAAAVQEARVRLQSLEALDDDDRITAHGKAISRLPLEPRLAHMLVRAGDRDLGWMAAEVAVLVTERGLGGNDADLTQRLQSSDERRGGKEGVNKY